MSQGEIDLLLTDVIMPKMKGQELSKRIHAVRPDLKVLFASGYTGGVLSQYGISGPDVNYIPKPFSVRRLTRKVRQILDDHQAASADA